MQIMPDTAKLIARQMGETYNPAALNEMNTNIQQTDFLDALNHKPMRGQFLHCNYGLRH
jgi:hypothetical protein